MGAAGESSYSSLPMYLFFFFGMEEVQNGHREKLFPHEDSHTSAHVAQRSCVVCVFGAFSKPASSSLDCPVILEKGRNCLLPVRMLDQL